MATCKIGEFAKSKAGHDKDQIFIILMIEDEYVYLVDGKSRKLDSPKKKKMKHIQVIHTADAVLQQKLEQGVAVYDEEVKKAIKDYLKKCGGIQLQS